MKKRGGWRERDRERNEGRGKKEAQRETNTEREFLLPNESQSRWRVEDGD